MNLLTTIPTTPPNDTWCGISPSRLADSLGEGWSCVRVATDPSGDQATLSHIDGRTATTTIKDGHAFFAVGVQTWDVALHLLQGHAKQYAVVTQELAAITVHPVVANSPLQAAQAVQAMPTFTVLDQEARGQVSLDGMADVKASVGYVADVPLSYQVFEGVSGGEPDPLLTVMLKDSQSRITDDQRPIIVREVSIEQMLQALTHLHTVWQASGEGPERLQSEMRRLNPLIGGLFEDLGWQHVSVGAA